ncbi:MAG: hypothetical protein IE909_12020 [Campylobacterales bacterium]|nr:hypothetical protein [Campylobacterales bacterium]
MKISSLVDICAGTLLNTPAISFVTQIHTNITKVNDGDAYFARSIVNVNRALEQGAFAIILQKNLYDKLDPFSIDTEIAWILTDDLEKSIFKVLRFILASKKLNIYSIDIVEFYLIDCFKNKDMNNLLILNNDITSDFEQLVTIEENFNIFGVNRGFLNYIYPQTKTIPKKRFVLKNLSLHSLFEVSFSNKNSYYEKIKLPHLYVNSLLNLLEYFPYEVDIKKLNSFNLFKPLFISKSACLVGYGQSNRFIICQKNPQIYPLEISHLKKFFKYGIIKVIDFKKFSSQSIIEFLKYENFNALYIKHTTKEHLQQILNTNCIQDSLF